MQVVNMYFFILCCIAWVYAKEKKLLIAFPSDLDQAAQEEINYEFDHPVKEDNTIVANHLPFYPEQNPYDFYNAIQEDSVFAIEDDPHQWDFFDAPFQQNDVVVSEQNHIIPRTSSEIQAIHDHKEDYIGVHDVSQQAHVSRRKHETIAQEDSVEAIIPEKPEEKAHKKPITMKQPVLSDRISDDQIDSFNDESTVLALHNQHMAQHQTISAIEDDVTAAHTNEDSIAINTAVLGKYEKAVSKSNGIVAKEAHNIVAKTGKKAPAPPKERLHETIHIKYEHPKPPNKTIAIMNKIPPKVPEPKDEKEYLQQQKESGNNYDYLYSPYDDPRIYDDVYQADLPVLNHDKYVAQGPKGYKPSIRYKPRDPYKEAVGAIEGCKFSYILRACLAEAAFYAALEKPFNEDKFMQKAYFCAVIFKTKLCRYCSLRYGESPYSAKRIQFGKHVINHWNCEQSYKTVALEQIAFFLESLRPLLTKVKLKDVYEHLPTIVMDLMRESASCALEAFRYYSDHQRREYARYKISDKELSQQASYTYDDRGMDYSNQVADAHLYGYEFNDLYGNGFDKNGHYDPDYDWENNYKYNGPVPYFETFKDLQPVDHILDNNFDKEELQEGTEPTIPDIDAPVSEEDFLMESDTPSVKTKPIKLNVGHIRIDLTNQEVLAPPSNETSRKKHGSIKLTDIDPKYKELSGAYHPDISRPYLPLMSPYSTYRKEFYARQTKRFGLPPREHHFLELNSKGSTCDLIEASVNPYDNCLGIDVCGLRCTFRAIPDCCWDKRRRCTIHEMSECRVYGVRKGFDVPIQGFVRKQYLRTQKYFDPLHRYIHKSQAFGMCKFGFQRGYDVDGLCVGVAYYIKNLDSGKSFPVKLGGLINGLEEDELENPVDINVYTCVEFKWYSPESACTLQRIRLEMKAYCCKVTEEFAHPQVEEMDVFSHEEYPFFTTDHKISAYNWARNVKLYRNQKVAGLSVQGALVTVDGCEDSLIVTEQVMDDVVQRTKDHQSFNIANIVEDDYFLLQEKSLPISYMSVCYGGFVVVILLALKWLYPSNN